MEYFLSHRCGSITLANDGYLRVRRAQHSGTSQ